MDIEFQIGTELAHMKLTLTKFLKLVSAKL